GRSAVRTRAVWGVYSTTKCAAARLLARARPMPQRKEVALKVMECSGRGMPAWRGSVDVVAQHAEAVFRIGGEDDAEFARRAFEDNCAGCIELAALQYLATRVDYLDLHTLG